MTEKYCIEMDGTIAIKNYEQEVQNEIDEDLLVEEFYIKYNLEKKVYQVIHKKMFSNEVCCSAKSREEAERLLFDEKADSLRYYLPKFFNTYDQALEEREKLIKQGHL